MPGADVGGLLRSGVAAMCVAAGVLHMSAAADHRGMAGHVAFFVAVAAAQSGLGAAVLWGRRPGRWLAVTAAGNLAVAFVWALSRTTGLPVDGSSAAEAIGFKDGISTLLELGAVATAGMWWLLPESARHLPLQSRRLASAMLGTGVWALGASGLFAGHTHSAGHTHEGTHAHGSAPAHGVADQAAIDGGGSHAHGPAPDHPEDHAHPTNTADPAGSPIDGHAHASTTDSAAHDPVGHHHEAAARIAAVSSPTAGPDGHDHHEPGASPPVPNQAAGHKHTDPEGDRVEGGGHDHGDGHRPDHDADRSGDQGGDEGGAGSPLDEVLKLIRPR